MSIEGYVRFLSAMGHQVRSVGGVYWFDAHPHIYMHFPFQHQVDPETIDWGLVLGTDGWVARFPCAPSIGRESYRIAADQQDYDFHCLSGKARNQTRRGLERCKVVSLDFEELVKHGIALNRETLERQGRLIPRNFEDYWVRYFEQSALSEGAHAWGAFNGGNLAAYLIAFVMDEVSHILIVRSSIKHLKTYPNNALIFVYLQQMLRERCVREVSIGLESIQEGMGSLDHFKFGMGFRKVPTGQRIVIRPWMASLLSKPLVKMGCVVSKPFIKNESVAKLFGLLRWYGEQSALPTKQ